MKHAYQKEKYKVIKMVPVKVYSTKTCPWCYRVKDYLKQKKIQFQDIDVSADNTAAREMISLSGQAGVPVININGKIIVGFDKDALDEALGVS
jgi:glutaredoxin-like YruB-family protein